jgi:hypothetical protein
MTSGFLPPSSRGDVLQPLFVRPAQDRAAGGRGADERDPPDLRMPHEGIAGGRSVASKHRHDAWRHHLISEARET